MSEDETNVAIACQGGGSHTAFTAGVIQTLYEADLDVNVVGFSGTSGGAVCALLAWYGHVHDDHDPGELLTEFWARIAASGPGAAATNFWVNQTASLRQVGMPLPEISPYHLPGAVWGQQELRRHLTELVDFEAIPELLGPETPALLISAIDVLSGEPELFREGGLEADAVLASTAEPSLFGAVEVDGRSYWDGLFAKNPPIQDFSTLADVTDPDEVWLVKINPQERARVPRSVSGILDRRNELAGNLSLSGEIRFVRQVNEWIEKGYLPERYTHTEIKRIRFKRELDWTSKVDRTPSFLDRLIRDGREQAEAFLAARE